MHEADLGSVQFLAPYMVNLTLISGALSLTRSDPEASSEASLEPWWRRRRGRIMRMKRKRRRRKKRRKKKVEEKEEEEVEERN